MSDSTSPASPRLPTRITPCSIINTVVEVRFQTELSASFVPGMIYSAVQERFPKRTELPHMPLPDAGNLFPELRYNPTVVMQGEQLALNVGPRCLFLSLPVGAEYPGWTVYRESLAWVLDRIRPLAIIGTPERLGLRYTDFFPHPLPECLQVDLSIGGKSEIAQPLHIVSTLPREKLQCRSSRCRSPIRQSRTQTKTANKEPCWMWTWGFPCRSTSFGKRPCRLSTTRTKFKNTSSLASC